MNEALHKEFETTYRACFPIAAELQPNLFSFELDDGEYVEAKVHIAFTLWQAARATAEQPDTKPSTEQDWAKLDGAVAFHLIERHAEDWADAGAMMDAWRKAKSQQDAAIESTLAEQSVPVLPTHGSFHTGVLVKLLLDSAFEILRPDSPEDCPEEPWMRVALGKKCWAILTATPRSIESQRSGDGS